MKQRTLKLVTILTLVTTLFSSVVLAGYWFQGLLPSRSMVFDQTSHISKPCHAQRLHCKQCVASLFCHGVGIPMNIVLTVGNLSSFKSIPYAQISTKEVVLAQPMKPPRN